MPENQGIIQVAAAAAASISFLFFARSSVQTRLTVNVIPGSGATHCYKQKSKNQEYILARGGNKPF
jgi:hypothetical protein